MLSTQSPRPDASGRTLSKPALFRLLGYEPHTLQVEVHKSLAPRRVLACGTRWGKTRCAAMETIAAALEPSDVLHPRRGWVVAPSYELASKVFREVVLVSKTRLPHCVLEASELDEAQRVPMRLLLRNMGGGITEIRGRTAENPDSLLGEGLDFLVIDEAARLKPVIWDSYLVARLMDKRGWSLAISTPKGKGWFYTQFKCKEPGWQSWTAPSWSNPHLSKEELDARRASTPDAVWRQEYGAEFLEGAGQVFRNVRELATGARAEPLPGERYYAGLDLAQVEDYTVLTIVDSRRRVVAWDRFARLDWTQQLMRIRSLTAKYNSAWTLIDSTGVGEPLYEKLVEMGVRCEGYKFTQSSKAALVNNLAMMVEHRDVEIPTQQEWPELVDELEAFQYSVTDAGNVKTGAPSGQHDDCVCALMLAAWAARDAGEFVVQEVG